MHRYSIIGFDVPCRVGMAADGASFDVGRAPKRLADLKSGRRGMLPIAIGDR